MTAKLATAADAAELIQSGETIATSGFVGIGVPETLLHALEKRFLATKEPRDLTLFFAAGQGDGKDRGLNRLGHDGLLARVIGGHWGLIPKVARLALENRVQGWNLPQGVISQMFRETAAGRKGVITRVGRGTFVDPRLEGGKIGTDCPDLVRVIDVDGEDLLFYPAVPIDVALLRATTADANGNLSMEREALVLDNLAMAMAARNCGGLVIAQVERTCAAGSIPPKQVVVPSALVDVVVVAEPGMHDQTFATPYSPVYSGEIRAAPSLDRADTLDARKVIARRAALELPPGGVVNLGIGMPEGVAAVAEEEGVLGSLTLTAEPGVVGGRPAAGLDFGAAVNPDAIITQNAQFDFYDGGGLDLAVLGMAEADRHGNVNVSRFGARLAGAGGFINISQNARKVVFAGTFTAGGLKVEIGDGALHVLNEGKAPKFIDSVGQVTFSSTEAERRGTEVLYVTERAVFRLRDGVVHLVEVAPGIDLERDVLAHMAFRPEMSDVATIDEALFRTERFGLEDRLFDLRLADRVALDRENRRLFLNFENLRIRTKADVANIRDAVLALVAPLDFKVDVIVNYNRFDLPQELEREYAEMVHALEDEYYDRVSRYTSSAFTRLKLGRSLSREIAPHLFESAEEARRYILGNQPES